LDDLRLGSSRLIKRARGQRGVPAQALAAINAE